MPSDPVAQWRTTMERVSSLVESLDEAQLAARVPACPDWTARDLLSHVVGLGADVVAGDEPDDHNQEWTQRQVDVRRGRTSAELLGEWRALAEDLESWMAEHGSRPLNDVVIHEQDLRSAVDRPGARDTEAYATVRERMVGRFEGRLDGLPPIALVGPSWTWCSSGPVEQAAVVLEASDFDLGRALMSRRTPDQLRAWTTRGDVTAHLPAFAGLGELPQDPLPE